MCVASEVSSLVSRLPSARARLGILTRGPSRAIDFEIASVAPSRDSRTGPTMFEARLAQGAVLKKVLDSVKDLVTDANFEADPQEGFKLQAMDSSHVSLVSLKLHANGFEHYRCDRPLTMGMNLMNMVRARERRIYFFFFERVTSRDRGSRVPRRGGVDTIRLARGSSSSTRRARARRVVRSSWGIGGRACGRVVERARVIFMHRASRVDASTRARGRRGANGRARGWRLTVGWYFEPRARRRKC